MRRDLPGNPVDQRASYSSVAMARVFLLVAAALVLVTAPLARGALLSDDSTVNPQVGQAQPWTGILFPGRIEAENFDPGGEGVGYHDTAAPAAGSSTAVGIKDEPAASGGQVVGWFQSGDWLDYTVTVQTRTEYVFTAHGADINDKGALLLTFDGAASPVITLPMPNTGSYTTFADGAGVPIIIGAGTHVLRVQAGGDPGTYVGDLDYIDVSAPNLAPTAPTAGSAAAATGDGTTDAAAAPGAPAAGAAAGDGNADGTDNGSGNGTGNDGSGNGTGPGDVSGGTGGGSGSNDGASSRPKPGSGGSGGKAPTSPGKAAPTTTAPATGIGAGAPSTQPGLQTSADAIGGGQMSTTLLPQQQLVVSPATNFGALATSPGEVIGFQPGTYTGFTFTPKSGQMFIGLGPNVILDGAFAQAIAFGGSASDVTIENMTIEHYSAGVPSGWRLAPGAFGLPTGGGTVPNAAINPDWGGSAGQNPHPATPSSNWTLNYVTVEYNRAAGVKLVDGSKVLNSKLDANGVEGYISSSANALVSNDEVAYNNTPVAFAVTGNTMSDVGNEAGGGKITGGAGNMVTHSEFSFNGGNAIWDDAYATVTDTFNSVHDNTRNGIMHEIGFDGVITDNVIANNGKTISTPNGTVAGVTGGSVYDQGAGIYWSDSRGTGSSSVTRNTVSNNLNGIMLISANRFPYLGYVTVGGNSVSGSGHSGWYSAAPSKVAVVGLLFNGNNFASGASVTQ